MANHNDILRNAAALGFAAGALAGGLPNTLTTAAYTNLKAAADTFGIAVDAAIPNDAAISAAGGVALPPTTAAIQDAQLGKTELLSHLCASALQGRFTTDTTAGDYATVVAAIVNQYTVFAALLV